MKLLGSLLLLSVLGVSQFGFAKHVSSAKGLSLAEIVSKLEKLGYGPIVEASLDDGSWEVELYKDDLAYELLVDPLTGEVLSEHRDDADLPPGVDAKSLSSILKLLEKAGYRSVVEVSYERRHWEIEAYRGGAKRELRVDPKTGEVLSDRIDD